MLIKQDLDNPNDESNSYLTLEEWRLRAATLGVALPVDDTEAAQKILVGMRYVDNKRYSGVTVDPFQSTMWPRAFINAGGETYPKNKIPFEITDAVLFVAIEDNVYQTVDASKQVKRKKIDIIETEYTDASLNQLRFKRVPRADALLSRWTARPANFVYGV